MLQKDSGMARVAIVLFSLFAGLNHAGGILFAQSNNLKTLAVLDFDSRGAITAGEAGTLAERLRSYLVHTGEFIVVERGKMANILQEQGFQQTGCTSNACAVEVGRILNVQEMVAGAVGKIGARYTLDVRLINVETAQILSTVTKEYSGPAEGLIELVELTARQLAGNVGGLTVTTSPAAATVFVDNRQAGVTPLKSFIVSTGQHQVRLLANGYKPLDYEVVVEKGKVVRLTARLQKKRPPLALYLAGGVAVAGGAAAYYFLKPSPVKDLPGPPALPTTP